jgi:hypothetical protein
MRVVAVMPLYPPGSRVGAFLATHLFLRALHDRGHDVEAFAYLENVPAYVHDRVRVETGIRGRTHAYTITDGADVVISHAGDSGFGCEVADAVKAASVRMVHGVGYPEIGTPALAVFNSEALRVASEYPGPSLVCHPPINVDDYRAARGDAITLVNCCEMKGVITAWRVADVLTGHRFLGVRGGYGEQVVARAPNFDTIPSTSDMRQVYERTRILLMPSEFETWGMVAVEAMCSGIPVIAHPTGGLRESLGDAGLFADRDDIDAWCNLILAFDDPATYLEQSELMTKRLAELVADDSRDRFCDALEAL